jgi:hypothetical protein
MAKGLARQGRLGAPVLITGVVAVLAAVLAYMFIAPSTRRDDCAAEILVNGRGYDVRAATKALDLEAKVSPAALAVITERLGYYANRSADLCRDFNRNALSRKEYVARKDEAAQFYMKVYQAAAAGALANVGPNDKSELNKLVTQGAAHANAGIEQLAQVTLTNDEGHILPTGATVRDGDRLALDIRVPRRRYLYVLGVGSSGRLYRLYPASSSSGANPVQGNVRIPSDPNQFIRVGGQPGREQLFIFVSDGADRKIEQVTEISSRQPARAAAQLRDVVVLRDLFAPPPADRPTPRATTPQPVDVTGQFGRAAITLELNHAR